MDATAAPETPRVYTKKEQALIERHRDINVDGDWWWEYVRDDVKEELFERGFRMDNMLYSGFWSQGDGACFEGTMISWAKFCEAEPTFVEAFPFLSEYLKNEGASYSIEHSGHYYHENCTNHYYSSELEWELERMGETEITDPEKQMRFALWTKALVEEGDRQSNQYRAIEEWLREFFKDKMRDLYKRLEQEYNYQTSDDAVWESIEANELDKQDTLDDEEEDYAEETDSE